MSEMAERVARVLEDHCDIGSGISGSIAETIIRAMREPTKHMLEEGAQFNKDDFVSTADLEAIARDCWCDMIDAALDPVSSPARSGERS